MPACLAAWNTTTHMPDRRAEEPEDARLSGRMEHDNTHARQAGRGTRRCPPVWQHGTRQHTCQTGGPRNQKMPACLAGSMEHDNTHARQAGRGTRRCPPVWQHGARQHTCQTGGPRNQKMPACLAAWSTTTHTPDRRAEEPEDARLSGSMEHDNTHARQAGRGTRRCPPVWQHGALQHTRQTGGPRNQKMPACLAAWSTTTHTPDRRAEEPEDARLSGSQSSPICHALY